jgi:hypothetical protein
MIICPKCQTKNHGQASFCESCGKSLASLREADDGIEKMLLKEARKGVWALGIVAVLQAGAALIFGPDMWPLWVIAGVFALLALWAMKAPLIASVIGLGVFVSLHLVEAVADPHTIYKGIILKIVVIGLLVNAIRSGLTHRKFRQERGLS